MQRDNAYLETIRICAEDIAEFVAGLTMNAFLADKKTRLAVERQLITMGEAANRVSASLKADHPDISWSRLVHMRNLYVHGYDHLTPEQVWGAAKRLAPLARRMVVALIPPEDGGDA